MWSRRTIVHFTQTMLMVQQWFWKSLRLIEYFNMNLIFFM